MTQIRKLSECRCISIEDKDVLREALKQRRDNLILGYEERLLPATKDRMEISLDKTEKMIKTIDQIPIC
jgi:hypothetical protein